MRVLLLGAATLLCSSTVSAAAPETGIYADALRTMLSDTAAGECPANIMGDELLAACRQQLPNMSAQMKAAGPITAVTFVSADDVEDRHMETYRVSFSKGPASTWHIGGLHDGKFDVVYSSGE